MELRCTRDLALALGAIKPINVAHHRDLKSQDTILVRDEFCAPLFWPLMITVTARAQSITPRSS